MEAASAIGARNIPSGEDMKSAASSSSSSSSSDHELEWHRPNYRPGWVGKTRKEELDKIVMTNKRLASKFQAHSVVISEIYSH